MLHEGPDKLLTISPNTVHQMNAIINRNPNDYGQNDHIIHVQWNGPNAVNRQKCHKSEQQWAQSQQRVSEATVQQ